MAANILIPFLLSWFGSEVVGQLYFGNPFPFSSFRFTYDTADSYRAIAPDLWNYRPNSELVETIVYKRPFGSYFVESTCRFHVDELGFVDNENGRRDYDILLLGDSFTAGSAGCAWTDELRRLLPGQSIYNAGIPGSGLANWAAAERYLLSRGFHFRHVFVLFIADDFARTPATAGAEQLACLHDFSHCTPRDYTYPLLPEIDPVKTSGLRNSNGFGEELQYFAMRYLWVSSFLVDTTIRRLRSGRPPITDAAKTALDQILSAGMPVDLVKISTKNEAAFRADDARSVAVAEYLAARGLTFARCQLSYGDFFSYDAHPTAAGYRHLAACLTPIVESRH